MPAVSKLRSASVSAQPPAQSVCRRGDRWVSACREMERRARNSPFRSSTSEKISRRPGLPGRARVVWHREEEIAPGPSLIFRIEDGSHTPGVLAFNRCGAVRKDYACDETRVAFLPAPLTARAVGTISKQAGLSIPGISGQSSGIKNDRCAPAVDPGNINACQGTDFGDW